MTSSPDRLAAAADLLVEHRLARRALPPLPDALRPADLATGYAIQRAAHARLTAAGLGPVVGHKIGCTTAVMQAFLNIPSPCAGGVFERTVHRTPAVLPHRDYVRVGVECEIVARLGADLPAVDAGHTRDSVASAVAALMPGMEIVDERYTDYSAVGTATLIADDFFDAGVVLGAETRDWRALDLARITGTTTIDGVEVGRGIGADVMGHPLEALAWLANLRAAQGMPLRAGEFVFLGSVVATKWVEPGAHVVMSLDPLGRVEARFPA
jgi:2-oxo-3-hexenedioate decarboxylase/2-keto-4-pentenoate hydratase